MIRGLASGRLLVGVGLATHAAFLCVSIAGTQIGLGIAAAGLLAAALRGWRPVRTPLDLPLLLFVGMALASDLLAPAGPPSAAMATLWRSAAGFWLLAQGLALSADPRRDALRLLGLAAGGLALASLVGVVQYGTGWDAVHALGLRAEPWQVAAPGVEGRFGAMGFYMSRLTFSHALLALLAALAGALAQGAAAGRARQALLAALLLGLAALVLTFARAAWLGLGAAGLLLAVLALRASALRRRALALSWSGVAALGGLTLLHPGVRERFLSAFDLQANADRLFIWSRALEIIRDHPLLGVGFGNYQRICSAYYDRVDPAFPMRTWAHNSPLSLLAETGPLGLLLAALVVAAAIRALWGRWREGWPFAAGGLAALAGFLVAGQVHDLIYDTKAMYPLWFSLALGLAPRNSTAPAALEKEP